MTLSVYNAPAPQHLPVPYALNHPLSPYNVNVGAIDKYFSQEALRAQYMDFTEAQIQDPVESLDDDLLGYKRYEVCTFDEASLDTLQITHASQKERAPEYQTYVIHFNCNFIAYEQTLDEMQDVARELQTNVIGFNYRGVNRSKGKAYSFRHLMIDGIAQVQRLLDQGVSAENITLDGLSIGGATATCVAWYFHQLGYKVNLFNDRSFSSTEKLVVSHLDQMYWVGCLRQ